MRDHSTRAFLLLVSSCLLVSAGLYASSCTDDLPTGPNRRVAYARVSDMSQALVAPLRVAADAGGSILVTDPELGKLMGVDAATRMTYEVFPVSGKPLSVGFLGRDVVVGDAAGGSLDYYDTRGRLRRSTGKGSIGRPTDIAVDQSRRLIFVVDAGARDVKVFDERGRLVRRLSRPGTGDDQLTAPVGIAVDPAGQRIFVSDWGDFGNANGGFASVKIFAYDGTYQDIISGRGNCGMLGCSGGFSRPQGMALDGAGRIYLADAILAQVLVIDPATKRVMAYLGGRPVLRLPTDVVLVGRDVLIASNRTASLEVVVGGVLP